MKKIYKLKLQKQKHPVLTNEAFWAGDKKLEQVMLMNEKKWTIGEMAKLFDLSTDTLRYYEKAGLLSSSKKAKNGYRYYSYDDLVILIDILFFRNMDVAVKDIRQIVTKMDLHEIKDVLKHNQQVVEDKIQGLIRQRKMLTQVVEHYELCEQMLGQFSIVQAPDFRYKFVGAQADDLFNIVRSYKKPDRCWLNQIRYTLFIPQAELLQNQSFCQSQLGISFAEENLQLLAHAEQQGFSAMREGDYLYTVTGTDYSEQTNHMLAEAMQWLQDQGNQVAGPLIGRYLTSVHKDGLDYYEIWVPIKKDRLRTSFTGHKE
ncbi:MerR family transcriptional regulator [Pelosinus fermentans]|uniref:Transcriptional regulator, MerR family n=1 Tax=Pelosinus fermentans JBW45 TaxID=1192197 RepID=I8TZ16_9FIRM|nr:MerR family transcriptional regulator [Pelosinus fermentans]AJQ26568.1 transcriptional regulator, MerR family [Pelosinus fermentans JBW45]